MSLFALVVAVILFGGYYYLRKKHVSKLDYELSQPLDKHKISLGFVGAVGAVTAYDAVHNLAMIDDRVLEAIDFSSSIDADNFNQLHNYVNEQFIKAPDESTEGSLNRLEGYAGEQVVAENLTSQGHVVEFPDDANQEGWDILVDGSPVQVKNTMDPNLIEEHLENYPDIPVIVNSEMASHFEGNEQVIVDHNMSHEAIEKSVQNTIAGVDSIGDGFGFDIPVITLALSSFKEGKLLYKGDTDVSTAATHVAIDTTTVGGGGFAGAQAGAAIGSAGGPPGAAIGGVIGGVIGALGGRFLGNQYKQRKLRQAMEDLNNSLEDVADTLPDAANNKMVALDRKEGSIKKRLGARVIRSLLWPNRSDLIYLKIKRQLSNQRTKLIDTVNRIRELQQTNEKKNGLSLAGLEAYEKVRTEGYFYPTTNKAMNKANKALENVKKEKRKLGK